MGMEGVLSVPLAGIGQDLTWYLARAPVLGVTQS